jgi:hypothetical protein
MVRSTSRSASLSILCITVALVGGCARQRPPVEAPAAFTPGDLETLSRPLFIATQCVALTPTGEREDVIAFSVGAKQEPYLMPFPLSEEGWERLQRDLIPALKAQDADPTKRLVVCMPRKLRTDP